MTSIRAYWNNLHVHYQLLVLLVALNYVDFQTTKSLVDQYGFVVEANPLLYWAMVTTGTVYIILAIKAISLSALWGILGLSHSHRLTVTPSRVTSVLRILVGAFFALLGWNFFQIFQHMGT